MITGFTLEEAETNDLTVAVACAWEFASVGRSLQEVRKTSKCTRAHLLTCLPFEFKMTGRQRAGPSHFANSLPQLSTKLACATHHEGVIRNLSIYSIGERAGFENK